MTTIHRSLARIGGTLAGTFAIVGSLLTFPAAIPAMIAFWLIIHAGLVLRKRTGWVPLVVCWSIVLIKAIHWTPGLLGLAAISLAVCLGFAAGGQRERIRPRDAAVLVALWLAWGIMLIDWRFSVQSSRRYELDPVRPVVCLGNSLTAFGYPDELARLLAVPVVDFGADGITSADGVARLPALLATDPQVVVVELGGHDFLRGASRSATKANLETIVNACRSAGADVVLMEIPRGFIVDPYRGLERQIAREHDLELIADTVIRRLVLFSPAAPPGRWLGAPWHLSDDGLHPNDRGNRVLAAQVARAMERLYGPRILKRAER